MQIEMGDRTPKPDLRIRVTGTECSDKGDEERTLVVTFGEAGVMVDRLVRGQADIAESACFPWSAILERLNK